MFKIVNQVNVLSVLKGSLRVNNRNTGQRHRRRSGVFTDSFEHISYILSIVDFE